MTFTTNETSKQALDTFQNFDADTQLAILWFGYLDIKDQLTPANATSAQDEAAALYHAILALPKEEQLQAQRDIVSGANSDISRAYKAVSSSSKLDVWLRLAQGMDKGEIIQVPSDYKLPAQTDEFTAKIKQLDFEERINFMRSAAIEMGAK
ncbi:orange carotenoid protein N-terminal domain-containing protein [Coleofasciculus sp. H7-2]|uniref:orange carotenoid protein N-terminal domain-containing protein n=1 Tax=Coleofasciculus sp. H7-2 TaxID=3351545 RepID=UPI003671B89D